MHYGPIMVDLESSNITPNERRLIAEPLVGGVLLFARNYQNKDQLKALIQELRSIKEAPLLIAVDHEGEPLWQFESGFTKIPAAYFFGKLYQYHAEKALQAASQAGFVMAAELLACGVDMSLAPVLDIDYGKSMILSDRCFHQEAAMVATLAGAFIEGMRWAGMAATGKHFPGHGGAAEDPHKSQAFDERGLEELLVEDLWPFQSLGPQLEAVMTAHVLYPKVDDKLPSFSRPWLQDILRGDLGFKGAIISENLSMKGANTDIPLKQRLDDAWAAGCDLMIVTENTELLLEILPSIDWQWQDSVRCERVQVLSGQFERLAKSRAPIESAEIWEML